MKTISLEYIDKLRKRIKRNLDYDRYRHTLGVMYTAGSLAMKYEADINQAMLAGLMHDCAKCIPVEERFRLCAHYGIRLNHIEIENPALIHAKLGAALAADIYEIRDQEILDAITFHTTGRPHMTQLDKILYLADYIEPNRNLPNLTSIRSLSFTNIDLGLLATLEGSLDYLNALHRPIDPMTEETVDFYRKEKEKQNGNN